MYQRTLYWKSSRSRPTVMTAQYGDYDFAIEYHEGSFNRRVDHHFLAEIWYQRQQVKVKMTHQLIWDLMDMVETWLNEVMDGGRTIDNGNE